MPCQRRHGEKKLPIATHAPLIGSHALSKWPYIYLGRGLSTNCDRRPTVSGSRRVKSALVAFSLKTTWNYSVPPGPRTKPVQSIFFQSAALGGMWPDKKRLPTGIGTHLCVHDTIFNFSPSHFGPDFWRSPCPADIETRPNVGAPRPILLHRPKYPRGPWESEKKAHQGVFLHLFSSGAVRCRFGGSDEEGKLSLRLTRNQRNDGTAAIA